MNHYRKIDQISIIIQIMIQMKKKRTMKRQICPEDDSMYYGLINILSVSTSFTIINPVNNARVASDLDWSMQYQESNQTTLCTNKDVVRLTFNGYFWEMIVNGSGTYCPDHRFSRITTMIVSQNCSLIRT